MPSEINHRANMYALKKIGVTHILSISATGSLKEELAPCDVVIPDQYFDRTKGGNEHTFFGEGAVAHMTMAEPVCPQLAKAAFNAATLSIKEIKDVSKHTPKAHFGGTYVNMEGPAFSTKAESNVYRQLGMDIIGMTNLAEAKLAREAEICYCTVAMITDYDCWHENHDSVTVELVINNLRKNVALSQNIICKVTDFLHKDDFKEECSCRNALKDALITQPENIPDTTREKLAVIINKYC